MKNLLEVVKGRTQELNKKQSKSFNTNDWLLDNLLDREVERHEVINEIIVARIEHGGYKIDDMKEDERGELIDKLFKTSKNGLDTSVSDSNNNSSFSYNPKYDGYELIKNGSKIKVVKSTKKSK